MLLVRWTALLRLAGLLVGAWVFGPGPALAGEGWPEFRSRLLEFHERSIAQSPVRVEQGAVLPYAGLAAKDFFYQDIDYYDRATGRLISHIRRSPEPPYQHYEIEVYVYDAQGRVSRDFAALTLPWQLAHPARTFINLHDYPGKLHAIRQFDASGEIIYESCVGSLEGRPLNLQLEAYEIGPKVRAMPDYQACFARLPLQAGAYRVPH